MKNERGEKAAPHDRSLSTKIQVCHYKREQKSANSLFSLHLSTFPEMAMNFETHRGKFENLTYFYTVGL